MHRKILLAFSPLDDEKDFSSQSYADFFKSTLSYYGKTFQNVICLVGDNCNTNLHISDITEIPFIGCTAHRLNLVCQKYIRNHENLQENNNINNNDGVNLVELNSEKIESIHKEDDNHEIPGKTITSKIAKMMSYLSTLKMIARVRELNCPLPVKRNVTRWTSTF